VSTVNRQAARSEKLIVEAATRLFVERGYVATTLSDVADAADIAERTIYGRFGTKAALFKRVLDVATVGDVEPVDVLGRDWMQQSFEAKTLKARIAAFAAAGRQIMERTGDLLAVAYQAAAVEPAIAAQLDEGRAQATRVFELMWSRCSDDRLVRNVDLTWLTQTTLVISSPQTFLHCRALGWGLEEYEAWLVKTYTSLAR
jgi:AcrR family transcriptional regulator